jgi:50S ribosomal protein L16 3-hydroxylase
MLWHTFFTRGFVAGGVIPAVPPSPPLSQLSAVQRPSQPQVDWNDSGTTSRSTETNIISCQGPFANVVSSGDNENTTTTTLFSSFWNQRPLVIRQAFETHQLRKDKIWPTWHDILNLAATGSYQNDEDEDECNDEEYGYDQEEEEYEENTSPAFFGSASVLSSPGDSARLIRHLPNQLDSFQAELGPFTDQYLHNRMTRNNTANKERWTLLVNDVDRWWNPPALADWVDDKFHFLPRWRRDDVQISIAPTDGGIGPHVDSYDVFLIQAAGTREWRIQPQHFVSVRDEMEQLIPDLSVRILHQTTRTENTLEDTSSSSSSYVSIQLQEGDVLYLPPRIVHWGISTSDSCMTLSVGCRAPSAQEMVARVAEEVLVANDDVSTRRYTEDTFLSKTTTGLEDTQDTQSTTTATSSTLYPSLKEHTRHQMKEMVLDAVQTFVNDKSRWDALLGKLITEPKRLSDVTTLEDQDEDYLTKWGTSPTSILTRVQKDATVSLQRTPGVSYATSHLSTSSSATTTDDDNNRNKSNTFVDRLYAGGVLYEVPNDVHCQTIFHCIERGIPLTNEKNHNRLSPDRMTKELQTVLVELIREGFLIAKDE